jgi:hypothetical protein
LCTQKGDSSTNHRAQGAVGTPEYRRKQRRLALIREEMAKAMGAASAKAKKVRHSLHFRCAGVCVCWCVHVMVCAWAGAWAGACAALQEACIRHGALELVRTRTCTFTRAFFLRVIQCRRLRMWPE